MIKCDLHIHTTFCDGHSTPAQITEAAIKLGLERIGFSGHSFTDFDDSFCMSEDGTRAYRSEVARLKAKHRDVIDILCGVEQDIFSTADTEGYDYVIGSVHYIKASGQYIPVDESAETLKRAAETHFGGDIYSVAEAYFDLVSQVAEVTGAHIIGHFDLVSKFNDKGDMFDPHHPRYVAAWQRAADRLMDTDKPFEINTGAISRGYRTAPYPAADMMRYISDRGGKFILTSDSHNAKTLCFEFDKWQAEAEKMELKLLYDLP